VVSAEIAHTTQHGAVADKTQTKLTNFYDLDSIIFLDYRVNFLKVTCFRQGTTKILLEYIAKELVENEQFLSP